MKRLNKIPLTEALFQYIANDELWTLAPLKLFFLLLILILIPISSSDLKLP